MDENKKVLCCTGHPPGGDYYGNCATGYCPNNSTCAGVMRCVLAVKLKDGSSECYIAFTGMDREEMRQKNILNLSSRC